MKLIKKREFYIHKTNTRQIFDHSFSNKHFLTFWNKLKINMQIFQIIKKVKQTEHKTSTTTIQIIEPNIFHNYVHKYITLTVDDAIEAKNMNLKLAKGKPYALLVSKGEFSNIPAAVRRLISDDSFAGDTIAKALLANSVADKLIGQFYIKVDKPVVKTKLFTDKAKAIIWLKNEIRNYAIKRQKKTN